LPPGRMRKCSHEHIELSRNVWVVAAAVSGGKSADEDIGSYNASHLLGVRVMAHFSRPNLWRGGRAVYGSGLENRQAERPRGFESHPLRSNFRLVIADRRFWAARFAKRESRTEFQALPRKRRPTSNARRRRSARNQSGL